MNRLTNSMRLMWFMALLPTALAVACSSSDGGGSSPTLVAPIAFTTPADAATDVPINRKVSAAFNQAMNPATITQANFFLFGPGAAPVAGEVTYDAGSTTGLFTPASDLAVNTKYTVTLAAAVRDPAGAGLGHDFNWSFTTGATADTAAPKANSTSPAAAAIGVPINHQLSVVFGKAMDPATINTSTFVVTGPGGASVAGTVTYAASTNTATFTPASDLAANSMFTATLTTGVKDLAGNALATDVVWTFTTGATADTSGPISDAAVPTVSSTFPANGASRVAINANVVATFAEAVDPATVTAATFTMVGPGAAVVTGTVTYLGTTAAFKPTHDLAANVLYTVTVTTGVMTSAGKALASAVVWTFTTGTTAAKGPPPVVLGTAGDYVILAKAAVSTTGTTAVVGNIGLSPSAESYLTGFSEALDATNQFATASIVTGKLYAANMAVPTPANLTTAISNMEAAYTDAAGRTLPDFTELGAGDVSGKTLVPGLYKWGTGLLMTSDITLAGGPNDVWIFQVAQDLTVSNGVHATLSGGALPKNIFWQVAGQAVLGTTSVFPGNILSHTKIVLRTGATLNGRALAQTAVTLDANAVTKPAL